MKQKKVEMTATTLKKANGELLAVASDETIDRVGDSIKVVDWDFKNFLKNPVLQAGHDYKPQYTIGRAEDIRVEGKKLLFKPVFHNITQLAREIGQMYQDKFLTAWSVGYIPASEEGKKHELLEVSAVAVPANPNALTSVKALEKEAEGYDDETINKVKEWIDSKHEKKETENVIETKESIEMDEQEQEKQETEKVNEENKEKAVEEKVVEEIVEEAKSKEDEVVENKEHKDDAAETVNEQIAEDEMRRKKYILLDRVDTAVYAFYKVYMEKTVPVEKFGDLLKELSDILVQIAAGKKELQTENLKDFTGSMKEFFETEEKEGKVISKKNKKIINDTIESLKNSTIVLEKLIELTEESEETTDGEQKITPKAQKEDSVDKSRKPKVAQKQQLSADSVIVRALQKIASNSNYALNQLNKNKK